MLLAVVLLVVAGAIGESVGIDAVTDANQHLIMYGGAWKGPHAEQNVMDAVALGYRAFVRVSPQDHQGGLPRRSTHRSLPPSPAVTVNVYSGIA